MRAVPQPLRSTVALAVVAAALVLTPRVASAGAGPTTTTAPITTTTKAPATTTPTTSGGGTATTVPTATTGAPAPQNSGTDIPWALIGAGLVGIALVLIALLAMARRRGRRTQAIADWRTRAADATAEAGATARLLSAGTPATAAVAQQVLNALRALEDLEASAPDSGTRSAAERARRVVQNLGVAIDADYTVRRAQPPASPDRLEGSAASLRNTASETDRALRALYRGFTGTA